MTKEITDIILNCLDTDTYGYNNIGHAQETAKAILDHLLAQPELSIVSQEVGIAELVLKRVIAMLERELGSKEENGKA